MHRSARRVEVDAQDGRLTLTGTVNSPLERHAAEDLVARTRGATALISQLRVQPEPEYAEAGNEPESAASGAE